MMRKYKQVPFTWNLCLFICTLGLSIFTVEYWNAYLQLKVILSSTCIEFNDSGGGFY